MAQKRWIVLFTAALFVLVTPALGQDAPPVNIFGHPLGLSSADAEDLADLLISASAVFDAADYDSALALYNQALEIDAENAEALLGKARTLGELGVQLADAGDYEAAEANFEAAVALYPAVVDVYPFLVQRGYLYWLRGDTALALVDFEAAVALDDSALAHEYRAHANFDLGNDAAALADYEIVLAAGLESARTRYNRGVILDAQGDTDGAIVEFTRALELLPDWANAHLYRASLYAQQGDIDSATPDYWAWITQKQVEGLEEPDLRSGDTVTLEMAEGRAFYLPFSGLPGQRVTITATAVDDGLDPLIVVLNNRNQPLIASDDISAENFDSAIEAYRLPNGRDFTLVVSHAGGGSEGEVEVTLTLD